MSKKGSGWRWFVAWGVAEAITATGFIGGFGVGIILYPIGGIALIFVILRGRLWPESLGVVAGIGGLSLLVAFFNRDYLGPCRPEPATVTRSPGFRPELCGGLDPTPWLIAGVILVLGALVAYAIISTGESKTHS